MSKVLSFDPSGSHAEGNGTTGWAWFSGNELTNFGDRKAVNYDMPEEYWHSHIQLIEEYKPEIVVYETYALRAGKAQQQSWSHMETSQLIGIIRHYCWEHKIPCVGQQPSLRKRYNDNVLKNISVMDERNRILGRATNVHMRDAIAHGLYYSRYGGGVRV